MWSDFSVLNTKKVISKMLNVMLDRKCVVDRIVVLIDEELYLLQENVLKPKLKNCICAIIIMHKVHIKISSIIITSISKDDIIK